MNEIYRAPQVVDGRPIEPARAQIHWRVRGSACSVVGRNMVEISRSIRLLEEQGFVVEAERPVRWGHDGDLVLVDCAVHRPAPKLPPAEAAAEVVSRGMWWIPATALSVALVLVALALVLHELLPYILIAAGAVVAAVVIGALVKSLTGGSRITQNNYFR